MRRELPTLLGAALLAFLTGAALANDAVASLAARLRAAAVVVDGQAGRPYTAWNGTDPATIVTYTPFAVHRVLKGQLANTSILLREPGGEVGGAGAAGDAGTEFVEDERDVVLLGERDPRDGSYPITVNRGIYQVTRDANGRDTLEIHLGVDAGTYPSREKGSGTPPVRVPLELVERLAHGEDAADRSSLPVHAAPTAPPVSAPPAATAAPAPDRHARAAAWIAAAIILLLAGWFLWRRRARR
jgi:hypothetical protein